MYARGLTGCSHAHGRRRDSFQNVVELLDDMFQRAAEADEPVERNFVKKHCGEMAAEAGGDVGNAAARLFSNPSGDYGSMVNERVGASNWTSSQVRRRASCCVLRACMRAPA